MPVTIPALAPFNLDIVPDDRLGWLRWRQQVLKVRKLLRNRADNDTKSRQQLVQLVAKDPAFYLIIYGMILEPRSVIDTWLPDPDSDTEVPFTRPKGWYPWVPYHFQVDLLRTIDETLSLEDDLSGKGDMVLEKSRDMGATWTFCAKVAHDWLFGEDVYIGLYSRKEDYVDSDNPNSMFFKIEALTGIYKKIPPTTHAPGTIFHGMPVRLPDYLRPHGFEEKMHDHRLNLIHPTKSNQIFGEATTSKSGIGSRTNYSIIDEGAKISGLTDMWSGLSAVTAHRFVLSSADRREGDGMFQLVEQGRRAKGDPTLDGPRLVTLHWSMNPMFSGDWYDRQKARHSSDPYGFLREYDIQWNAGMGNWTFPGAQDLAPEYAPYHDTLGQVDVSIDPGIADPTAVTWMQAEPGTPHYRLVEALVLQTPSAEYLAPILMGFPRDHAMRAIYQEESIHEVMDFTWSLRQKGFAVRLFGDPYGNNSGGSGKESFYESLLTTSRDLNRQYPNLPAFELRVMTKYDEGARYHPKRKESLTKLLRFIRFHDVPRVRYVLEALRANRYKTIDETRSVMNETMKPLHDWSSHSVSALEFWSVMVTARISS